MATILIIDDNPADIELMRIVIGDRDSAIELAVAENGMVALALLARIATGAAPRPDLVLLDLNMPGMGGCEFLRRLRADPTLQSIAVLVVTSESSHPAMARLLELGAGSIRKPFKPEELTAAASVLLANRAKSS